jgi:hypothetical protein
LCHHSFLLLLFLNSDDLLDFSSFSLIAGLHFGVLDEVDPHYFVVLGWRAVRVAAVAGNYADDPILHEVWAFVLVLVLELVPVAAGHRQVGTAPNIGVPSNEGVNFLLGLVKSQHVELLELGLGCAILKLDECGNHTCLFARNIPGRGSVWLFVVAHRRLIPNGGLSLLDRDGPDRLDLWAGLLPVGFGL